MGIWSFFSRSKPARKQAKGRKPVKQRLLDLETLEDRCVPTTTSLSQSISFVSQQTGGISAPGLFNQFNTSLGVLNSITIAQSGSITSDIEVENTSTLSPASISATVAGSMNLTGPGISNDGLTLNPITETFAATVFDGTLDFGGTSGTNFGDQSATGSNTITLSGSQLTPFEGTSTVGLNVSSTAGSNATSNVGNLALEISSTASATVTITYNYTPNNASLAGIVYVDANDTGSFVNSDTGIAGVTLTLTGTTSQGATISQTTTTGTGGTYSFTGLAAGTYSIAETPPTGYLNGSDNLGSLGAADGTVSANNLSSIAVAQGQTGTSYNFGALSPASLSGIVYLDVNDSGSYGPGDTGIGGVAITLTGTNDLGQPVIETTSSLTSTGATNGSYSFTNLRPGTYTITEAPPSGYLPGTDNLGSLGGKVGTYQLESIVVAQGNQGTEYNFGELTPTDALTILKTASASSVPVGSQITYTVTVSNTGASTADGVSVSDPLPAGETYVSSAGSGWTITNNNGTITATEPSLAVGASSSYTVTVLAPSTAGSITNTATVTSTTPDTNPDNQSSVTVLVTDTDSLTILKTASASSVPVGSQITYTVTVSNTGTSTANGVSVSDPLPAGETYVSSAGSGWTITNNNGTITATEPSLAVGASSSYTVTVLAPSTAGSITNTATVTSTTPDTNPNNQSSVTVLVSDTDDLSIVKTASASSVAVDSQFTYTLTVSNQGSSTADGVSVSDPLPAGETYVSSAGSGWTITNNNGTITATEPTLAVGASSSFTITVLAPSTVGPVTNTATVTSTTPDSDPNNNQSSVTTQVTGTDDLTITKTANASSVTVGSQLTYTLTVSNAGPLDAAGVTVTDPLPAGTTYISGIGPGWTITNSGNTVTATTASLPVGVSTFFTITVQVPSVAGSITNTATVTSTTPDSNPDPQGSVTTIITNLPGTTDQGFPAVVFGPIPVFTKTQLVGGTVNSTTAALASWVESMYLTLTGQAPSPSTLSYEVLELEMGRLTQAQLVSQLYFSGQFIDQEITNIYQNILGTAPTSSQLSTAASELETGTSLTTLEENLLTSAAYLQTHTSPNSLVAGLDQAILGTVPSLSSLNVQVQSLGATTWNSYVQAQTSSAQAYTLLVDQDYEGILGRSPTSSELNSWVTALQNNTVTPDQLIQQLFASQEFVNLAYANA